MPLYKLLAYKTLPLSVGTNIFNRRFLSHKTNNFLSQFIKNADTHKIAVTDNHVEWSYKELHLYSEILSSRLYAKFQDTPNREQLVAIGSFNKPSVTFLLGLLATWKLGREFVPLSITHTANELSYFITDSKIGAVVCESSSDLLPELHQQVPYLLETKDLLGKTARKVEQAMYQRADSDNALVVYTSGTTGRPKGARHTHSSVTNMIKSLVSSWQYNERDRILHFLPLYHVHGLVNKLLCVLFVGGRVDFLHSTAAPGIWKALADCHLNPGSQPLTLFMAVPTVYAKLLETVDSIPPEQKRNALLALKSLRLAVSGSAALPDPIRDRWMHLTGLILLERYGMTELGMALSNPYMGERRKGYVGMPMPFTLCKIVDDDGSEITKPNTPGELRVKVVSF